MAMNVEAPVVAGSVTVFHALGEPSRMTILQHLLLGEHRVVELTAHLGLAQSTVSKHLACLRDCGLVSVRPVGRASVYAVTQPDLVRDLLAVAERLHHATGGDATAHRGDH